MLWGKKGGGFLNKTYIHLFTSRGTLPLSLASITAINLSVIQYSPAGLIGDSLAHSLLSNLPSYSTAFLAFLVGNRPIIEQITYRK